MKIAPSAALLVAALVSGVPAANPDPVVETLVPLPGHTSSKPFDINEFVVVVGQSYADLGHADAYQRAVTRRQKPVHFARNRAKLNEKEGQHVY